MRAIVLAWAMAVVAGAQTFDAASVKPAGPFVPGQRTFSESPGRLTYQRATLATLMMEAYDVWSDQIVGPAWVDDYSSQYTVIATMPPETTRDHRRAMLRNLLAERFGLRLHRQQQTRPAYELVVAEGGHKLEEWTAPTNATPWRPGPNAKGFPSIDPAQPRGVSFTMPIAGGPGLLRFTIRGTMADFCRGLGAQINASNGVIRGPLPRVVDRTGLTAVYEFSLAFQGEMSRPAGPSDAAPVASDPGPSLFSAVEQLGLKLRKGKDVPVEVLVVDHAAKAPIEN